MAKKNLSSPNITHHYIPDESYSIKQGNTCPNYKTKPSPLPEESNQVENTTLTPTKPPTYQTQANLLHNSINFTRLKGSHAPQKGNT